MLHLYTPGGIDRYFAEWQAAIGSGETDDVIAELAGRYGLAYETAAAG